MTDQCIIGPVSIAEAVLFDERSKTGAEEILKVTCTPLQAKQLEGLQESATQSESGNRVIISGQNRGWGMIPIDSSIILTDNEDAVNRGYYQVVNTEETYVGPNESEVKLTVLKVANLDTLLEMWSTRGYSDGTKLNSNYVDNITETILDEEFTTFNSGVWFPKYTENMASGADITSSGGKLQLVGASATNWTWGYLWTVLRETLPDNFTIEFPLEWVALPGAGVANHQLELFIIDGRPGNKAELEYKDLIRVMIRVSASGATLEIGKRVRGSDSKLIDPIVLSSSQKTPMLKLTMSGGTGVSTVTVEVDKNWTSGTPTYTKVFDSAPTGIHYDPTLGRYLMFALENASSTSATVKVPSLDIYKSADALPQKVVLCPPDATLVENEDFTRIGEEGTFKAILNPSSHPLFYLDSADFYNGSVKAYNSNYPDSVSRLVTNTDAVLDPLKFYVKNGLVKLVTTADSILFQYWNGTQYVTLNEFEIGTIYSLKVLYVSPYLVRFQANETKWTLKYGKPFCMVEHPTTTLLILLRTHYYHDAVPTLNPAANADISMDTQYYCNIYGINNLVHANAATGTTLLHTTEGFSNYGSTTESSTEWSLTPGGRSLKVICLGTQTGERAWAPAQFPPNIGQNYAGRIVFKGTLGDSFLIVIQMLNSPYTVFATSTTITATGSEQTIDVSGVCPTGATTIGVLIRKVNINTNPFFIGQTILVKGTSIPDFDEIDPATGELLEDHRLQIFKVRKTTIKSDSIPASEFTGIGFYDNNELVTSNNHYVYLAREFLYDIREKIRAVVL